MIIVVGRKREDRRATTNAFKASIKLQSWKVVHEFFITISLTSYIHVASSDWLEWLAGSAYVDRLRAKRLISEMTPRQNSYHTANTRGLLKLLSKTAITTHTNNTAKKRRKVFCRAFDTTSTKSQRPQH
jgi:hypothetical protein